MRRQDCPSCGRGVRVLAGDRGGTRAAPAPGNRAVDTRASQGMSVKIMGQVFYLSGLSPAEKLTFLALADHADDEGVCWPSIDTIALKCCQSARNVRRTIRNLEELGQIVTKPSTGRKTNRYILTPNPDKLSALRKKPTRTQLSGLTRTQLCPPNHQGTINKSPSQRVREDSAVGEVVTAREADPFAEGSA